MLCFQHEEQRPTPELGQIVAVRQRLYLVEQSVPPVNPGDSTLIQLSCVDDDAQGQPLEVGFSPFLIGAARAAAPIAGYLNLKTHVSVPFS